MSDTLVDFFDYGDDTIHFNTKPLTTKVKRDEIVDEICNDFDYTFEDEITFDTPEFPPINKDFSIGLIVGPSGSGKSTILKYFGDPIEPQWDQDKAVVSHFENAKEAQERLAASGLNAVPSWLTPYHALSNGQQYRANLARVLDNDVVVDEFTSVVDRTVAKSCANAINRYVKNKGLKRLVFASCHYDIIDWLQPDWVFDTATGKVQQRGSQRRPKIVLEALPVKRDAWSIFRNHHYLSHDINPSSRCWIVTWDGEPVGFGAVIALPSGTIKNAFRGHRTVVLPDYQGLGLGARIPEMLGEIYIQKGKRYFTKTVHPRLGAYRNNSPLWKPTSKNGKQLGAHGNHSGDIHHRWTIRTRPSYTHEYIGTNI
jgi:energy-coupling factor transporter ATP-binding protein EcfA2